jgi:hypothetical protein
MVGMTFGDHKGRIVHDTFGNSDVKGRVEWTAPRNLHGSRQLAQRRMQGYSEGSEEKGKCRRFQPWLVSMRTPNDHEGRSLFRGPAAK